MAGTYRSNGNKIGKMASSIASSVKEKKLVPAKKAYVEKERRRNIEDKIAVSNAIATHKANESIRVKEAKARLYKDVSSAKHKQVMSEMTKRNKIKMGSMKREKPTDYKEKKGGIK